MKFRKFVYLSVITTAIILTIFWAYRSFFTQLPMTELPAQSLAQTSKALASTHSSSGPQMAQGAIASLQRKATALRPISLTKADLEMHPKLWMLAFSEQDAAWLAAFGYPSMNEEATYDNATVEQLRALVDSGDQRARINLGLKMAETGLKAKDATAVQKAGIEIGRALVEGGPYEAAKAGASLSAFSKAARDLGDIDSATKQAVQDSLVPYYELARGLSGAYGDYAATRLFNSAPGIGHYFGIPATAANSNGTPMANLGYLNRARIRAGLTPYTFDPRPAPPNGSGDVLRIESTNNVYIR